MLKTIVGVAATAGGWLKYLWQTVLAASTGGATRREHGGVEPPTGDPAVNNRPKGDLHQLKTDLTAETATKDISRLSMQKTTAGGAATPADI